MNDDFHRFGALRESYAFEYAVLEQADKNKNTHFDFDTYDTYSWYLALGPLSNINATYLHGTIPFWNDVVAHPDYDSFWKKESWISQLHASTVPNLNVAGFWDQEDPWGPWQIFRHAAEHDPTARTSWLQGLGITGSGSPQRATASASSRSAATRPRANFARRSRLRSFATTCTGEARSRPGEQRRFSRARTAGAPTPRGHQRSQSRRNCISTPTARCHSTRRARTRLEETTVEYVSDPANPVP